jgi:hypothetical protein
MKRIGIIICARYQHCGGKANFSGRSVRGQEDLPVTRKMKFWNLSDSLSAEVAREGMLNQSLRR